MKTALLNYLLENDRIPNKENEFLYIATTSKSLIQEEYFGFPLYIIFKIHENYRNRIISESIKKEIKYFLTDLNFEKYDLEKWVSENMKETISVIKQELEKQINNYNNWLEEFNNRKRTELRYYLISKKRILSTKDDFLTFYKNSNKEIDSDEYDDFLLGWYEKPLVFSFLQKENTNQKELSINNSIKREIEFFIFTHEYELEKWVSENMKETISVIKQELEKQINNYNNWLEEYSKEKGE